MASEPIARCPLVTQQRRYALAIARGGAMSYDEAVTFAADALQTFLRAASPGAH